MKSFYKKTFVQFSPLFLIIMIPVLYFGAKLRLSISKPVLDFSAHIDYFNKFGFTKDFILNNISSFLVFELIISIVLIFLIYILGKTLAGNTAGLFSAIFLSFYPYFIINCYNPSNLFLLFFMLYLIFQLLSISTLLKKFNILAGIFLMISIISNPICIILSIIPHIYLTFKARNIVILYNFLFFIVGIIIAIIPFILLLSLAKSSFSSLIPIQSVFGEFNINFTSFLSSPLSYVTTSIWPFIKSTLAHPFQTFLFDSYSYLHYVIITLSIIGSLYALVDEKIRIITLLLIIILLQAFFMPSISFSYLFILFILTAGYMVDKVFKDVFC